MFNLQSRPCLANSMNLAEISLRIISTESLSKSHTCPIALADTYTVLGNVGKCFERGEMFKSFSGKENLPASRKSRCGTIKYFSSASVLFMNLPT
mmetsp:Transcript_35308/g.26326  ORF Transcript_35308/g.26326 Transcript_35308/m.26326 type:complete len:95 (-) Transcript_35308:177-461(-)